MVNIFSNIASQRRHKRRRVSELRMLDALAFLNKYCMCLSEAFNDMPNLKYIHILFMTRPIQFTSGGNLWRRYEWVDCNWYRLEASKLRRGQWRETDYENYWIVLWCYVNWKLSPFCFSSSLHTLRIEVVRALWLFKRTKEIRLHDKARVS